MQGIGGQLVVAPVVEGRARGDVDHVPGERPGRRQHQAQLAAAWRQGHVREAAPAPGWRGLADVTLAPGGCELRLVLAATGPLAWYVIDITPGLPPSGQSLLAARPPEAAPVREGDLTVFSRRVVI